ncbi:MAG TPA: thioredoxin family protein [Burkholderiaceae bacterium]|nr:thioredoxin family protein [Burkholderiaceae bacterium]
MSFETRYSETTPSPDEVSGIAGPMLLEFGTDWCGHCRAAQPLIAAAMAEHPSVRHLKIMDGPGLPLGRSFRVTLWPTLVFLRDGAEVSRLVRPRSGADIDEALAAIGSPT